MSIEKRRGEGEAGVGEAWSGSILRMCDLDCRIIVFRRQFTSSVYFLHATPPGLCHCRLIAWLVELVLFYHSMVAASRRLCNMFAFCRCYCPGLLGSLALCARPLACSCLYQSSPPELENSPLLLCASFNIMWIYTDACACVCVYVFAHECCACVLRMHKCVVLTYASGLARFFRVQVCTCVHT